MDNFQYLSKNRTFALILYKTEFKGFPICLHHI